MTVLRYDDRFSSVISRMEFNDHIQRRLPIFSRQCNILFLLTYSERSRRTTAVWRAGWQVSGLHARTHSRLRGSFHVAGARTFSSSFTRYRVIRQVLCREILTKIPATFYNKQML